MRNSAHVSSTPLADLPAMRRTLRQLAKEGAVGRWWYEKSARAVLEFARAVRLRKEVASVEDEIKKIETEKKAHSDESAFLKNYVRQAQSNVKYYYDLLDKIDAAEKARAEAERAAAAAKKS